MWISWSGSHKNLFNCKQNVENAERRTQPRLNFFQKKKKTFQDQEVKQMLILSVSSAIAWILSI